MIYSFAYVCVQTLTYRSSALVRSYCMHLRNGLPRNPFVNFPCCLCFPVSSLEWSIVFTRPPIRFCVYHETGHSRSDNDYFLRVFCRLQDTAGVTPFVLVVRVRQSIRNGFRKSLCCSGKATLPPPVSARSAIPGYFPIGHPLTSRAHLRSCCAWSCCPRVCHFHSAPRPAPGISPALTRQPASDLHACRKTDSDSPGLSS